MKVTIAFLMMVSSLVFADEVKKSADSKTFKSMDGTYEVVVDLIETQRCHKKDYFIDHTLYLDKEAKACALGYKKMTCKKFVEATDKMARTCAEDQWFAVQSEKTIASARNNKDFCMDKMNKMIEKFKADGFECAKVVSY